MHPASAGQGQHDRALGDRGPAPRAALSHLSRRAFPPRSSTPSPRATGRGVLGNVAASGTEIIEQLRRGARAHAASGSCTPRPIPSSRWRRTRASFPLEELYAACETARRQLVAPHDVSRVIARPFVGQPGPLRAHRATAATTRIAPPGETLLDALAAARGPARRAWARWTTCSPAGHSARATRRDNAEGIRAILEWLRGAQGGLLFANLVDFDTLYGHRGDVAGFERALRQFDDALPAIRAALRRGRPAVHHRRPRQRPHHGLQRSRARSACRCSCCGAAGASRGARRARHLLGPRRHGGGVAERGVPRAGTSFLPELERGQ